MGETQAWEAVRTSRGQLQELADRVRAGSVGRRNPQQQDLSRLLDRLITLICRHGYAVETAVHPLLGRVPAEVGCRDEEVAELRSVEHCSYQLARTLGGDSLAAGSSPTKLVDELITHVDRYLAGEKQLLDALAERLSAAECDQADERFRQALSRAPSRAHTWTPHGRVGLPLRAALAHWDRLVDLTNNRNT